MEILGKARSSIYGNPKAIREDGNLGTAKVFEPRVLEHEGRVLQPPEMRETFAAPTASLCEAKRWGKIDLSEKTDRFI